MAAAVADQLGGIQQRPCNRGGLDIERPQHARRVASKAPVSLRHVGQRIVRHRIGQARSHSHQVLQPVPAQFSRNGLFEPGGLMPGFEQCLAEIGEGSQGPADGCPGVVDAGIAEFFGLPPGPADDTVMGLDEGVRKTRLPFHGAHRQDGQPSAVEHLAQAVREVPFPLPPQAGNAVGGYALDDLLGETETLQKPQSVQQAPGDGGIVARLGLPQPDEARHAVVQCFRKQPVESRPCRGVETARDSLLDPAVGCNCSVGAQAFERRDGRQDELPSAAFLDEPSCQLFVGPRLLGLPVEPGLQVPRRASGERAVAVDRTQRRHVFLACLPPRRIGQQGFHRDAQLDTDEFHYRRRDQFVGLQHATGMAQGTKLKGEAETVFSAAALADVFQIVVCQGVVLSAGRLVGREIEQGGPLPVRENGSAGHGWVSSGKGWTGDMGSGVEEPSSRLLERAVGVQVMVERARGNAAKLAADIGYRARLVGHEVPGVAQLLGGHDAGAAAFASTRPRRLDTLADALADDVAFHFREGCLDLQKGAARRRGCPSVN